MSKDVEEKGKSDYLMSISVGQAWRESTDRLRSSFPTSSFRLAIILPIHYQLHFDGRDLRLDLHGPLPYSLQAPRLNLGGGYKIAERGCSATPPMTIIAATDPPARKSSCQLSTDETRPLAPVVEMRPSVPAERSSKEAH